MLGIQNEKLQKDMKMVKQNLRYTYMLQSVQNKMTHYPKKSV